MLLEQLWWRSLGGCRAKEKPQDRGHLLLWWEAEAFTQNSLNRCHYNGCSVGFWAGEASLVPVTAAAPWERQTPPGAALRWFLLEHPIVVTLVLLLKGKLPWEVRGLKQFCSVLDLFWSSFNRAPLSFLFLPRNTQNSPARMLCSASSNCL